ncbi:MAG: hypothetical protein ACLR06_14505 [Christensenellaceae bacterium]
MTKIAKSVFGNMPDGREVYVFTFEDGKRKMEVLSLGALSIVWSCPTKTGTPSMYCSATIPWRNTSKTADICARSSAVSETVSTRAA